MARPVPAETRIHVRVIVRGPLPGVAVALQLGRDGLQAPKHATKTKVTFETEATVTRTASGDLRLSGPAVQGPPSGRFLYINWGRRAGQNGSCWDRRAKVMLTLIGSEAIKKGATLEAEVEGVAGDGGPCCGTVPLRNGWQIV